MNNIDYVIFQFHRKYLHDVGRFFKALRAVLKKPAMSQHMSNGTLFNFEVNQRMLLDEGKS